MHTILIVIHLLIVLALVGIVLVQKSEGGGLGIGGGSGFMSARGAANTLTRTTGILAAAFFATSLALSILARYGAGPTDILDRIPSQQSSSTSKNSTLLDKLNGSLPQSGSSTDTSGAGTAQQPPSSGDNAGSAPSGGSTQPSTNSGDQATPSTPAPAQPDNGTAAPSGSGGSSGQGGSGSQVPTGQ